MEAIIAYLKNPTYIRKQKFEYKVFLKALLLDFLFTISIIPILAFLHIVFGVERTLNFETTKLLLGAVFFAPIIEEFIFRLYLRPTKNNLLIYFLGLLLLIVLALLRENFLLLYFLLFFLGIFGVFYYLFREKEIKLYRSYIWYFKHIFYFSCLLFGLIHTTNFNYTGYSSLFVLPIMVLPQIFAGGVLGFIRMKYGILYSILLHSCVNTIASLPILIKLLF